MNTEIKKYADSGDIKALKYIFVDSLDVDPTFVRYEEEYNYCKSIPGLLESHLELTPFRINKAEWNEEYWTSLKMDLVKNFSDERMSHMRKVAKVFLADKVERILAERVAGNSIQSPTVTKAESTVISAQKSEHVVTKATKSIRQTSMSKAAEQARQLEEEKRKLDAENKAQTALREREARERAVRIEQQRREQERASTQVGGEFPKKSIGIAVAAVAVAVVLFLLLK